MKTKSITKTLTYTIKIKRRGGGKWHIGFIKGPFLDENDTWLRAENSTPQGTIAVLLERAGGSIGDIYNMVGFD